MRSMKCQDNPAQKSNKSRIINSWGVKKVDRSENSQRPLGAWLGEKVSNLGWEKN